MPTVRKPIQSLPAFSAEDFRVEVGANMGDPLGVLDDLVLDDDYVLSSQAVPKRLGLAAGADGRFFVANDTDIGTPGAYLHLDCSLTLMPEAGDNVDALVMVEVDPEGMIAAIYLLPLTALSAQTSYTLVRADRQDLRQKLAQVACVSFTRGTRITLATGAQAFIEDLKPGDRVLTRDDGIQEVRWVGQTTTRAVGTMAPILIRAGALNNANDLIVSPEHRLMVYQRQDELGAGCSELLIRARHLVNGNTVVVQEGGFVDYFQLLFDRHHIIYAEGIAAESLLLDPVTTPALPPELLNSMTRTGPRFHDRDDHGLEVQKSLLDRPDAVTLLKRASLR